MDKTITDLLHTHAHGPERGSPISPPLVASSTFHLPDSPEAPFQYGRFSNPTWEATEKKLSLLEGAESILFPSGMAALSALFYGTLKQGDTVLIPADGYYSTRVLAETWLSRSGIRVLTCPLVGMAEFPMDGIQLVLIETPSNPGLEVVDFQSVTAAAHRAGARVAADNTTMTSYLQRPLDHGVDIVVQSDTKAASGHSDLLMGHLTTRDPDLLESFRKWRTLSGSIPGPFESWLLQRGLGTLKLRLDCMCQNALEIARRLREHPAIQDLRYPGLENDPAYEVSRRQMDAFGYLIAFTLVDEATAESFIGQCPYLVESTSFGGLHSSAERRSRWGENTHPGFVRMSIGVEPLEILWESIETALGRGGAHV